MKIERLIVAGLRASGSGYPNADQTLKLLSDDGCVAVRDLGKPLPPDLHLWTLRTQAAHKKLLALVKLGLGNLLSLIRVVGTTRGGKDPVYVPYPSLFFMWLASWMPGPLRPHCIVDAYISVWDTMFRDRSQAQGNSLASRWIKRIEARALRAAALVLVDTQANRACLIDDFGLDPGRVRSLPLAIDEDAFLAVPPRPATVDDDVVRVLFVGTLIPLHGVCAIVAAMRRLLDDPSQRNRFHFRFIGDGQLGSLLEEFVARHDARHVSWVREWRPLQAIASEIEGSDICLGVFGGEGKAARVLPFKLYMYLAAGRAVISQAAMSLPDNAPMPPVVLVDSADEAALVDALAALAMDRDRRRRLAEDGRAYYRRWLSGERVLDAWRQILS
ncbi:MAG: glycosyltransferase [Lysobacter sp.]|nr:glycosyltransferase [Lysobacter sp.]